MTNLATSEIAPVAIVPAVAAPRPVLIPDSPELTKYAVKSAVRLAVFCIVGALVLCLVLVMRGFHSTDDVQLRILLSCVAVFVAAGFVAIGFSLFLLKADGELKATIVTGTSTNSLNTSAPGLAVVVCAVVVMYFALHGRFSVGAGEYSATPPPVDSGVNALDAGPLGGNAEVLK